jgi:lysophospholipase L1-like esterase
MSGTTTVVAPDVARTPLRLVVLGDSIAYGTGARRVEDSLGPRLSAVLTGDGFDVDLHVLAVPGAASAQLADQVRRAEPLRADLAVVVIGANDLARFVPPDRAAADLGAAVTALRAGGGDVVVVPAPDMSSVPFVPPAYRPAVQAASAQLQHRQTAVAEAAGATVADTAAEVGRAFAADPELFSADRFHPSSAGYAHIAAALAPTVLAAARRRRDGDAAA